MEDFHNQKVNIAVNDKSASLSRKEKHIRALMTDCEGYPADPHFLAFFRCFNTGRYFEAHEVLEALWLQDRRGPIADFYKGLIQLAGAMVHLQKNRAAPGIALFKLARKNLEKFPETTQDWQVGRGLTLIDEWLGNLQSKNWNGNPLQSLGPPQLPLPELGPKVTGEKSEE